LGLRPTPHWEALGKLTPLPRPLAGFKGLLLRKEMEREGREREQRQGESERRRRGRDGRKGEGWKGRGHRGASPPRILSLKPPLFPSMRQGQNTVCDRSPSVPMHYGTILYINYSS